MMSRPFVVAVAVLVVWKIYFYFYVRCCCCCCCLNFFVLNFTPRHPPSRSPPSVFRAMMWCVRTQIGNNLKYWPDDHEVVSKTLQLFLDMASGYSSSKMLLGLDTVKFLMRNHTEEFFPFLVRFCFFCGGGVPYGIGRRGGVKTLRSSFPS